MTDEAEGAYPEKNDSSGFVDHLRLVHLTLCLSCLVTIIAVSSKELSSASRAYQQTATLLRVQSQWQNGQWLREFAAPRQKSSDIIRFTAGQSGADRYALRPLNAHVSRRYARFDWFALASDSNDASTALRPDSTDTIKTLADAQTIWDELYLYRNAVELIGLHDGWSITGSGTVSPIKPSQSGVVAVEKHANEDVRATDFAELLLRTDLLSFLEKDQDEAKRAAQQLVKPDNSRCYLLSREASPAPLPRYMIFRAECSSSPADLQELLTKGIEPLPPPGSFSSSFPDVAELAKNLKTLSLPELLTYFKAEEDRAGKKIELTGVKLPALSVSYWGTGIMFAMVIYWLSVFRDFAERATAGDKAWTTPWIGTSTEALSRAAFALSIALPPFTTFFLIFKGADQGIPISHRVGYALAASVVMCMLMWGVISCWVTVQRIQAKGG